ncbi:MAG: hypothetical protein U0559_07710 [Anaerolineae bacterium]
MAKAEIFSGVCGFTTTVEATMDGKVCNLSITSDCAAIRKLGEELTQVNPFREISTRRAMPQTLEMGAKYCTHAACPVPVGIIKAVEVEAKLALPKDVTIKLYKSENGS